MGRDPNRSMFDDFTWIIDVVLVLIAFGFCCLFFVQLFYGSGLGMLVSGLAVLVCGLMLRWWRGTEEWK